MFHHFLFYCLCFCCGYFAFKVIRLENEIESHKHILIGMLGKSGFRSVRNKNQVTRWNVTHRPGLNIDRMPQPKRSNR